MNAPRPQTLSDVRAAYAGRAEEYAGLLGTVASLAAPDLTFVGAWARSVTGSVIDVGCGPGQWTDWLRSQGVEVEGIDPVPEFVRLAQQAYPRSNFRVAQAEATGLADGACGGVLAWYSLIHTDPAGIDEALAEFSRIVRPGGSLALGFFEGPELAAFDHAITTAYAWPAKLLAERLEAAGFAVERSESRTDPGSRRHGAMTAVALAPRSGRA